MLLLGSRLLNTPVLSLQTGGEIARTVQPVIDPANLGVVAYTVDTKLLHGRQYFVRPADVRELSDIGMIIDSIDELVSEGDVIKLDEMYALGFMLEGMSVRDETGKKLGKVVDYTLDTISFIAQQLTVKRPLLKSFNDTQLLVHRSQIIEINNDAIVVHSRAKAPEHTRLSTPGAYVNPFRKTAPAPQE